MNIFGKLWTKIKDIYANDQILKSIRDKIKTILKGIKKS